MSLIQRSRYLHGLPTLYMQVKGKARDGQCVGGGESPEHGYHYLACFILESRECFVPWCIRGWESRDLWGGLFVSNYIVKPTSVSFAWLSALGESDPAGLRSAARGCDRELGGYDTRKNTTVDTGYG